MLSLLCAFSLSAFPNLFGKTQSNESFVKTLAGEWSIVKYDLPLDGTQSETNQTFKAALSFDAQSLETIGELNSTDENEEEVSRTLSIKEVDGHYTVTIRMADSSEEIHDIILHDSGDGAKISSGSFKDKEIAYSLNIPTQNAIELTLFNSKSRQITQFAITKKVVQNKASMIQQFLPMILMVVMQLFMNRGKQQAPQGQAQAQGGEAPQGGEHQKTD